MIQCSVALASAVAFLAMAYPLFDRMPHPYDGVRAVEISLEMQTVINRVGSPFTFDPPFDRNERLRSATRLFEGQIHGSESVAVRPNGELVMLDKFGYLHRAHPDTDELYVLNASALYIGPGRPLGFHVVDQGAALLVCDSLKGLVRVELDGPRRGDISILANSVEGGGPISYANDLSVAANGTVYFTSSTEGAVALNAPLGFYDTMASYMLNAVRGDTTGRLLAYDPTTRQTRELMDGLFYANGVAVAPDQSFVAVVETSAYRVQRYWLTGPRRGDVDTLVEGLPGAPDGITVASDGNFWLSLIVPASPIMKYLGPYRWIRQLLSHALHILSPLVAKRWGCVVKISPAGRVIDVLYDPDGERVSMVSAVTEHEGRLFLGNLGGSFVSVLDL